MILGFNLFLENINNKLKAWFGNSKIVDSNGNPKVCYHGTNESFDTFRSDVGHANDAGFYGKGFYFTHDEDYGENEAAYYGRNVIKVYLKVENPYNFDSLTDWKGFDVNLFFVRSLLFLYNVAKQFPEISNSVYIDKARTKPISILPKLVEQYDGDVGYDEEEMRGEDVKSAYIKSKVEIRSDKNYKGDTITWEEKDYLGDFNTNLDDRELEIAVISEALEKYHNISTDYHIEGYMTRNPQITDAIRKEHDGIIAGDEIIVFEPSQIKSIKSKNFDPNSDNIYD